MIKSTQFMSKKYSSIWLLFVLLIFPSCSGLNSEPSSDISESNSQVQEPYPSSEGQLQAAYPGSQGPRNDIPVQLTPLPTIVPPPSCEIEPPTEIAMLYGEAKSDLIVFAEPTIVATYGVGFSIAEWLPDNRRLLVALGDGAIGIVSTVDVTTGEMVEYAQRRGLTNNSLIWLEDTQGVMYVDAAAEGWKLHFSNGQEKRSFANELASTYLAKDPFSERIATVFSSEPGALMTIDPAGQTEFVTAKQFNEETKRLPLNSSDEYRLAWSPNGIWIAQYRGENLYLINTQTQIICSVDLGDYGEAGLGRVFSVEWSPDGHYLSMGIQRQKARPELNILNVDSMEMSIFTLPVESETWPPDQIGRHSWSPDGQMILLQVGRYENEMGKTVAEWFLADIQARQFMAILPDYKFLPGNGNIVWSLDGSKVAFSCPTLNGGSVCLMNILSQTISYTGN